MPTKQTAIDKPTGEPNEWWTMALPLVLVLVVILLSPALYDLLRLLAHTVGWR